MEAFICPICLPEERGEPRPGCWACNGDGLIPSGSFVAQAREMREFIERILSGLSSWSQGEAGLFDALLQLADRYADDEREELMRLASLEIQGKGEIGRLRKVGNRLFAEVERLKKKAKPVPVIDNKCDRCREYRMALAPFSRIDLKHFPLNGDDETRIGFVLFKEVDQSYRGPTVADVRVAKIAMKKEF